MSLNKRVLLVILLLPCVPALVMTFAFTGAYLGHLLTKSHLNILANASGSELMAAFSIASLLVVGTLVALTLNKTKEVKS